MISLPFVRSQASPISLRIDIDYVPDRLCIESKSLKFYLASYRNERAFNEAVTNRILDDFVKACAPREAIVTAQFSARGGIALTVRAEYPDSESQANGEICQTAEQKAAGLRDPSTP